MAAAGPLRTREGAFFLAVMFLGYLAFTADRTVLSAVLKPLSSTLGGGSTFFFGLAGTAWLASAQFIGVLAFVFISGRASDRYGQRRVVLIGVAVFTAFTWLVGFSSSLQEAFAFRLISGFGEGMFWPAAMSAVANYFGSNKGMALGIFYAGFDVGGASGNVIGSATFALTSDWRTAFFFAPLLGLPVLASVFISRRTFALAATKTGPLSIGRKSLGLFRTGRFGLILVFAFLATWASVWQVAYLPYYYSTVLGASVPEAGLIGAAVLTSGLAGKLVFGRVSDSARRDRVLVVLSLAVVLLYLVFFSASGFVEGVATALAIGFFSSAIFPVMQALASDSSGGETGAALGMTTTFQSAAAVIGTLIPGSLLSLGVGRALAIDAMVPSLLALAVALFLADPRQSASFRSRLHP